MSGTKDTLVYSIHEHVISHGGAVPEYDWDAYSDLADFILDFMADAWDRGVAAQISKDCDNCYSCMGYMPDGINPYRSEPRGRSGG